MPARVNGPDCIRAYKQAATILIMNKPLAVWGLLLLAGFLVTQSLVFSYDSTYLPLVWLVVALLGLGYGKMSCSCRHGFGKKKCNCCGSPVWCIAVAEGIILTAAIIVQFLPISPFYILSVWLILAGAAALAEGLKKGSEVEAMLGMAWLFSAVFFPFVNNFQSSTFIVGALLFGALTILAGVAEKG
jgi:hypothetical protein